MMEATYKYWDVKYISANLKKSSVEVVARTPYIWGAKDLEEHILNEDNEQHTSEIHKIVGIEETSNTDYHQEFDYA